MAVGGGVLLVLTAALVGWDLIDDGVNIFLWFPPLLASWHPHAGAGTVAAVIVAAVVVLYGPAAVARMRWRWLLVVAWLMSVAWTFSLAMVDGFRDGVAGRLETDVEYLRDVPRVDDIGVMLREFSEHILYTQPEPWGLHVGAHPPGVLMVFVWLDRLGLGGGGAAGVFCILVGGSACVAVAIAVRALGSEATARAALPFGVLFPGAVWVGVSADGMFAGVLAWAVAMLALGATRRGWRAALFAVAGGMLLGFTVHLSYGLVLGGVFTLAVLAVTRRIGPLLFGLLGFAAVVGAFAVSGFWWLTGYDLVKIIYADSIAKTRPYAYFVWANLAALTFALGPAALAGIRRLAARPRAVPAGAALLCAAALVAVLAADISGLSKAEVERIWLPFAVWLMVPCALLLRRQTRAWLAAQAALTLAVVHLLWTVW
ncbi:hypothetical protein CFN78_21150 [Amycolatopsis antarctica]|uniref:Glycosyltransferase RgtA/B/C/D-like domain-containing protein n=1 Tax=Amycolatopsis antarctica TaxID=1854586 RepID=A0A263CYX1_9PSEU|nr:hypothetical protein CFN78_21150 [Amycolatopsis antarctica]